MKCWVIKAGSQGLEQLVQEERARPRPAAGQVLVRVHAASLNYRDQAVVTGQYFGGVVQRDTIPLSDGAGEVVEVGVGVTRVQSGDRVTGTFFQGWVDGRPDTPLMALGSPLDGMLAEYVVLDQHGVVALPAHLSYEEGATLSCAALTAWNALMESGTVRAGQTVLALGTGGVSIFALQFARMAGARVIITSASDAKLARARALGAESGVNYHEHPDWEQEVLRLTAGQGVDHVIEVGGAGTLARSFRSVGHGGQVSLIGVLAGHEGDTGPHALMLKGARLQGIFVGNRAMFERMNRALEVNRLHPVVDRVFEFGQAHEAWRYQWERQHFGKIVIRVG